MPELPILCTLGPDALRARREGLLVELSHRVIAREPLPNGVRFQFAADSEVLALLARAIDAERLCCRFLTFAVTVAPDEGPITLDMTGPAGSRAFLDALLDG